MTDLSRYADWTSWLTERAAADPDVRCVWVGGSPRPVGTTSGRTSTSTCSARRARRRRSTRCGWRRRGMTSTYATCGRSRSTCGRTADVLRQPPGPAGALLEPTRIIDLHVSDLSDQHSHLDVRRHGTPIVLHDPTSCSCSRRRTSRTRSARPSRVRQRARPTSGWSAGRSPAVTSPRRPTPPALRVGVGGPPAPRRALPVAPRLPRAALPARGPAARRGRPDREARARRVLGHLRGLSLAASPGWTSCWMADPSPAGCGRTARRRTRPGRGAEHHVPDREASSKKGKCVIAETTTSTASTTRSGAGTRAAKRGAAFQ